MAIIPAHNEEAVVGNLIESLRNQTYNKELYDIYVIADNCTDNTAKIARDAGAIVYERFDETKKTKGYALNWFLQQKINENADYDAAKNEQAQIEGRIKTIEKMLENVEIIKDIPKDVVGLGSTVAIKYVDDPDDSDEYQIVGSQEADPFEGRISNESPIAKALLNHKVGDIITVESPNGSYDVEITEIK